MSELCFKIKKNTIIIIIIIIIIRPRRERQETTCRKMSLKHMSRRAIALFH